MKPGLLAMLLMISHAGFGWTSGGGGLSDGTFSNPWFIQNTHTVKYCIKVDEENFVVPKQRLDEVVRASIAFWKNQLSLLKGTAKVGTQKFTSVDCENSSKGVDLRFLFGTLTKAEESLLGDRKEYIGIAYRERYNREKMRAKGFIYIAPDRGRHKFRDFGFIENPWSLGENGLLQRAIVHELGHVFGIPHTAIEYHIMNQNYLTTLLHKHRYNSRSAKLLNKKHYIYNYRTEERWYIPPYTRRALKIPEEYAYQSIMHTKLGHAFKLVAFSKDGDRKVVGSYASNSFVTPMNTIIGAIRIFLPEEQMVYPSAPEDGMFLKVRLPKAFTSSGIFTISATGETFPMAIEFHPIYSSSSFGDKFSVEINGSKFKNILSGL